ncbi:MAG: hypothetical protein ACI8VC_001094 [Candidatus Endobugula sp.]|jgi:hypothetical protein
MVGTTKIDCGVEVNATIKHCEWGLRLSSIANIYLLVVGIVRRNKTSKIQS